MQAIVANGQAYIHNADGRPELYDIVSDPNELNDLSGATGAPALSRFEERVDVLRTEH